MARRRTAVSFLAFPYHGMTPLEWRLSFRNRKRARAYVQRILDWRPERLVIAHGLLPEGDAAEEIRKGFRWLF